MLISLCEHDHRNTDKREDRHPSVGLQVCKPSGSICAALDTVKSRQPGGDRCTKVCAEDNADRLREQHGTRVYKTDYHYRGCGRGLNYSRNAKTQQKALDLT